LEKQAIATTFERFFEFMCFLERLKQHWKIMFLVLKEKNGVAGICQNS
jgi:hypothetical protein